MFDPPVEESHLLVAFERFRDRRYRRREKMRENDVHARPKAESDDIDQTLHVVRIIRGMTFDREMA